MTIAYELFKRQVEVTPQLQRSSMVLNWDMRLGKTRAVLHAFEQMAWQNGPRTLVVVCPSIAKGVWMQEAKEMGLELPTQILDGKSKFRTSGDYVPGIPRMIVLNWEIVDDWLPRMRLMFGIFDERFILVLDETHEHCSNPKNLRYKAVRDLSFAAERTWLLTGTLYRTSAFDLHYQLRLLGPQLYPHYYMSTTDFGVRFCEKRRDITIKRGDRQFIHSDWLGIKNEAQLIAGIPIDRRLEEVTELPESLVWWLDEGARYHYSGGEDAGAMAKARAELSRLKALRVVELIRRNNLLDKPLVVFGWHHMFFDTLEVELRRTGTHAIATIDGRVTASVKTGIVKAFTEGRINVVMANIESAGMSIDLAAASNAVFGEIDWVKATMNQAEARIRGPRQTRRPCYWYALCLDSVDEFVWRTCLARGRDMKRLDAAQMAV